MRKTDNFSLENLNRIDLELFRVLQKHKKSPFIKKWAFFTVI